MNIKNDKRIIIEKETNLDALDFEKNKYYLEEYFPYRKDSCIVNINKDNLDIKKLKIEIEIEIDTFDIKDAINFLQEYENEIKKEKD